MKMRLLLRHKTDNNVFDIIEWYCLLLVICYCSVTHAADNNITGITPGSCESFHYDCEGCREKGCHWCTYDSLCFTEAKFVPELTPNYKKNDKLLYPNKLTSCETELDFTQTTCSAPVNIFNDPMSAGQWWIFDKINVIPVW